MSRLGEQIQKTLLPRMHLPGELEQLFTWIEANGLYVDRPTGERDGFLFPEQELRDGWTDTERPGGTIIQFHPEGNALLKYWFGHERPEVLNRVCVFARAGADGSMAAFWLDPSGVQKIVHMGSGSGSTLVCVLAENAIDFLRLLAIGYDEICWPDVFVDPPNANQDESFVHPNVRYQEWVRSTFGVEIPKDATAIVRHPDDMSTGNSPDPFNRWVAENVA